jgi:hypothetical protein
MAKTLNYKNTLGVILMGAVMTAAPTGLAVAQECPVARAVVISNMGDTRSVGSISQSFVIPPGYESISGRLRFLSDEWPRWYKSPYKDTYLARFSAPGKVAVLRSGNVNSSLWSPGIMGYDGKTPELRYTVDASGLAGKTGTLHYEVRDVGDKRVNSALAIDAVKVVRTQQFVPAGGSSLTGNGTISGTYGQAVRLTFKNLNVLGTTLKVTDKHFDENRSLIPLPQQSVTFEFTQWGEEPMNWEFDVATDSDAFIVNYSIESTWVKGMPTNPYF